MQPAGNGGGQGAGQIGQKQQAETAGAEQPGCSAETEGQVGVQIDEDHEVQPAEHKGGQQPGIAEVVGKGAKAAAQRQGLRGKTGGFGQHQGDDQKAHQAEACQGQKYGLQTQMFSDEAACQPATGTAQGVARYVQTHCGRQSGAADAVAQVGDGDSRQYAQTQPQQGA